MAIPYRAAAKSLKKSVAKHKKPVAAKKVTPLLKGKPLFTPPGMDAEDLVDGGADESTEKN